MKKLIMFLTIILLTVSLAFGDYVEIGSGTGYEPTQWPFYNYYENNKTQTLYLSSEIGDAISFESIGFNIERVASSSHTDLVDFTVNFLHTDVNALTDGAYHDMTGATQVFYSASYTLASATGWNEIDITDFAYNGTQNLIVEIIWGDNGSFTSICYRNFKTDDGAGVIRTLFGYADHTTPPNYNGSSTAYSNIRFNYTNVVYPGLPTNPSPIDTATGVAVSGDLTWDFGADTDTYDLWFGPAGAMTEVITGAASGASGSYQYSGLDFGTLYEWQVIAHNSADATTNGPVWSFITVEIFVADPPINLLIDELGYATWEAPIGRGTYRSPILSTRDFIGYNVYLDGAFVESTTDLFWQYEDLNNGQTYIGGVTAVYDEGESDIIEVPFTYTGTDAGNVIIAATKLNANYPNPFNPVTNIAYSIKETGNVTLEVYNIKGQLVKTLVNDVRETGEYTVTWNGRDNSNKSVTSGVYFYKMKAQNYNSTKKMILMK